MGEFILVRWEGRLRHDSLLQEFSCRGDVADRVFTLQRNRRPRKRPRQENRTRWRLIRQLSAGGASALRNQKELSSNRANRNLSWTRYDAFRGHFHESALEQADGCDYRRATR